MHESKHPRVFPFTANIIKWIAIIAMLVDHFAWSFIKTDSVAGIVCHSIGRITGPVMFFFISEGYHYTRNLSNYIKRLAVFAVISEIPYSLFMNHGAVFPLAGNVIITLLCGLCAIIVYHECKKPLLKWGLIAVLTAVTYWTDWSFLGVIIILVFEMFYGNRKNQFRAYFTVNLIYVIICFFQYKGNFYNLLPLIISPFLTSGILCLYNGKKGGHKESKWIFYIIYPLQFLLFCFF